jgi:hypothetical protein
MQIHNAIETQVGIEKSVSAIKQVDRRELRGRQKIMADKKIEARENLTQSLRQTNQAIAESMVEAQGRNIELVQNTVESGVEVLEHYAQDSRSLLRDLVEHPQKPQDALEAVLNMAVSAQERNLRYMQSVLLNSTDALKSHIYGVGDLAHTVIDQAQRQQDAAQKLVHESVGTYMDMFRTPIQYYRQALDTAQSFAQQEVEAAQKATDQGLEAAQKAARQGQQHARTAAK